MTGGSPARAPAIATLAKRQHGVITRSQLVMAGMSNHQIDQWLRTGRLQCIHRGVYLLGPIAPPLAREIAAVFACGEGTVLSHRSAAALWQLLPSPARDRPVDVTVPAGRTPNRRGIRVHRTRSLDPDEATSLRRIPVTTPARTLLDLAAQLSGAELEQAVAQAERRHLVTRAKLAALLARYPRRRGAAALRALLQHAEGPALTRSDAEKLFLSLVRRGKLPAPDTNVPLDPYEVDCLWREERLVVEIDSFAFHGDRRAFEADRRRDAELAGRGLQVIRVTWRQIVDEPEATLTRIAQALARR
ncbi:MAG: hypothetical protein QOG62_2830 [Thermoleophilaceae bacterium]|nr:hypothetical protein [Thermoleophilaceae bacterium]